jgi:hypothetical protein
MPKGDRNFAEVLKKELQNVHDNLKGDAEYAPIVLSVYRQDGQMHTDITAHQLKMKRLRPEKFAKEVVVEVPSGPFQVMNSGTGRANLFYQQTNGAVGLKEMDGKGIWAVPFKEKLCGTAQNVDYYDNGNLQVLFGAGSKIYLIDRRGAFVSGFPKDLGKGILIGPDVFKVNDEYGIMVLHKDNSIEMYDLHAKKPASWKGIVCDDPVRGLPERLKVGERDFWIVRTSIQTLIYPFYGGKPLNSFTKQNMFIPTAEVFVKNATTVEAECYDGKIRSVNLYK